jgi:hypothetical protein
MTLLNKGRLEIKLGEYSVGQIAALTNPLLVTKAQDYRRQVASRMLPLESDDILQRFAPASYHVSLKVDGEFDLLVYEDGESILVNPGGTVRVGLALLKEANDHFAQAGVKRAMIAGEFYYTRAKGKRPRVHDVTRISRQPEQQSELDNLGFAAFDIVDIDGGGPSPTFDETWGRLAKLFQGGKKCGVVESMWLKDAAAIQAQFRHWVEQGAEGAVVRSDALGTFKLKPRHTIDAVVIGFTEGTEDRRGMVHDLLVALRRNDGCLHVLGHVGGGFAVPERQGFLSDLKDMTVKSDYVEVNDQVAYHMVRPELVIEVSVLDLLSQTTRGMPINRMVLEWNAGEKRYGIVRRLPLVGLISPQFVRRREDKSFNANDVRLSQVTDLVDIPFADRDARQLHLAASQVLRRAVCTKELKGQIMVRKLVMWQTNKERDNEDFPAYVIHSTDFSPNRKTPLERDIRVSNSKDQIEELWNELSAEAFVKGWAPAGADAAAKPVSIAEAVPALVTDAPKKRGKKIAPAAESPAQAEAPSPEETPASAEAKPPAKKRASPKKKTGDAAGG